MIKSVIDGKLIKSGKGNNNFIKQLLKRKTYKEKAQIMHNKIIRKEANLFKKLCIKEFTNNIKRGILTTTVDSFYYVTHENEVSEIVLKELKEQYKDIEFSLCRHKGICMKAI